MPHPGHFICSNQCRFILNTWVNGYIVSTVGEYFPSSDVRKILANSRGIKIEDKGDYWDADYMQKIGFEPIGLDRLYETMVFKAKKSKEKCCPYVMRTPAREIDFAGYNDPGEAYRGHLKMCNKYDRIKK